jgi:hypothetical protein
VDRGSPNASGVTQEFFEVFGAELSFARIRRPTDNALIEQIYGRVKQEEIYLLGNYPDEQWHATNLAVTSSPTISVGRTQALFNFTPAHVHQLNNKSVLMQELDEMKRQTREKRKAYWAEQQKISQPSIEGGYRDKGRTEIVDPGANTEAVFNTDNRILTVRVPQPKTTHSIPQFCAGLSF